MTTSYSNWSIEKLEKEIVKIQGIVKTRKSRDKKAALAKVVAVARKNGFELHELVDGKSIPKSPRGVQPAARNAKKRGKVAPKYNNPSNPNETWTGRGRKPVWVRTVLDNGGSLDDVTI